MADLRFTLVSEGSSDRALLPLVTWVLRQHTQKSFRPQWADLRKLPHPPRKLPERVRTAVELFPCDLLFVHRDADRAGREERVAEIRAAIQPTLPAAAVCVIPIRSLEAWLLFDELAIRRAAGNPNGRATLDLPKLGDIEQASNPKNLLTVALQRASGLSKRRLKSFPTRQTVHRVSDLLNDFSPLRRLSAFAAFEGDLKAVLDEHSW